MEAICAGFRSKTHDTAGRLSYSALIAVRIHREFGDCIQRGRVHTGPLDGSKTARPRRTPVECHSPGGYRASSQRNFLLILAAPMLILVGFRCSQQYLNRASTGNKNTKTSPIALPSAFPAASIPTTASQNIPSTRGLIFDASGRL